MVVAIAVETVEVIDREVVTGAIGETVKLSLPLTVLVLRTAVVLTS